MDIINEIERYTKLPKILTEYIYRFIEPGRERVFRIIKKETRTPNELTEIILQYVEPGKFVLNNQRFHFNMVSGFECRFRLITRNNTINYILYVEDGAPQICSINNTAESDLDIIKSINAKAYVCHFCDEPCHWMVTLIRRVRHNCFGICPRCIEDTWTLFWNGARKKNAPNIYS